MTTLAMKTNLPLRGLALLLVAQLALAALLAWWQDRGAGGGEPRALFTFETQAVERLVIEGPDNARVELKRRGSGADAGWVVANAGDFPADATRVRELIDKLHGLKAADPVATSVEALERFKVADTAFERRVSADAGGKAVATLLLGTSQGARQTHARKAADAVVLSVDWPIHGLSVKSDEWLDKNVLRVSRSEIEAIEIDGLRLARIGAAPSASTAASAAAAPPRDAVATPASGVPAATTAAATQAGGTWQASGLPAGRTLDTAAADSLAQAIAELSFTSLRGRDEAARQGLGEPQRRWRVQRRGGTPIDYRLYKLAGSEDHVLVVSGRSETFTLAAHQARPLLDAAQKAKLMGTPVSGG